jgi:NitT/TauT family transport system ATP-binding protein
MSLPISIRSVTKVYNSKQGEDIFALDNANCEIKSGSFVSFVGPSGCGKSTLLHAIAGLHSINRGTIEIGSEKVTGPRISTGIMFQSAVLFPWRTVMQNMLVPVEILGLNKEEFTMKASKMLEMVGLNNFENKYPSELSGGMQQRVALARVLLNDPQVLLLDEPFSALDEFTREALNLELLRIWSENTMTVGFVTHNIAESVLLSDKVVVMSPRPGRIVEEVDIKLPRPRTLEMMAQPEFQEYVFHIRQLLGGAVYAS